jgi:hypothetical protein
MLTILPEVSMRDSQFHGKVKTTLRNHEKFLTTFFIEILTLREYSDLQIWIYSGKGLFPEHPKLLNTMHIH